MGSVAKLLPPAVVIAVGPTQVIAVILLLLSRRAITNSVAFLAGWVVGLTSVTILSVIVERPALEAVDGNAATLGAILQLVIGLGLIGLAIRKWLTRPRDDELAKLPGWMASIESVGPRKAVSIGLLVSGPNVKIILLTLAAMLAVTEAGLTGADAAVAIAVYVLVGSSTVILPVLANVVLGHRAATALVALRSWLERNYGTIVTLMLLAIGILFGFKGLSTLIA